MYASKVFQSIRFSTSRLSTAVCSALTGRRVCMMGWTVGKPKLKPWPRRKRCCQAGFEFFDHTRFARPTTLAWPGLKRCHILPCLALHAHGVTGLLYQVHAGYSLRSLPHAPAGGGHGGTRNSSTSRRVQTWSVSPAAMAGVLGCHRLAEPVPL